MTYTLSHDGPDMKDDARPKRDPTIPCPTCGTTWLYTNVYDQCYQCGRNIGEGEE